MNERAIIDGCEYFLVEVIPVLQENQELIICQSTDHIRYACPEDLWQHSAPPAIANASTIDTNSSAQEKITFFLSMFCGRENLYARRYYNYKTEKSGYVPACKNEWAAGLCDKRQYKCPSCPNRDFLPLTAEIVKAHLLGRDPYCRDVVGIYPMLEDERTWLLAADFDGEDWTADVAAFRTTCREFGLTPAVERSRSGRGAHVWFFFSEPVSAADARRLGSGLLTHTMACRHELNFKSYDRLFPSQDTLPKGGFGNLIALPFQGQAQKNGNSLFVDEQFVPYLDQWEYLSTLPKITPDQLSASLKELCPGGDLGQLVEEDGKKPWPVKHKKQKLTQTDFPIQARLMISNLIYIDKAGFSQAALNTIKRLAAFRNPEFYKKQAMRLRIYDTPRVFDCSYEDTDFLGIPRGCMDSLTELLDSFEIAYTFEERRCNGRTIDVSFEGTLRPEQIPAAEALLTEDMGVLSATTAFGKTVIGAYLISQRKVNTLILVHSSALLEQWKTSLEQFLSIREPLPEAPQKRGRKKKQHLIGQIGSGKDTRSGIVDIAIMQSLFEGDEKEVKPFVSEYGMVICDECHHIAAFTFEKILRTAEARYVYGLSATPVRQDGHQPIIFMQCGPVRYLVDAKSQAEKRSFSHFVIPRFTRARLPKADGIQDAYSGIIENSDRNELIVSDTLRLVQENRTPLLLTERKEHAIQLADTLSKHVSHVFLLLGSDKQKDKREKLATLRGVPPGEPLVVVATGKYIGEGFDEPRLDTMLLAMPVSWKGTLAQYAGRLHRNYVGKQEVRIYDYVDIRVPMLEKMYHKRLKGYSELGYQVKTSDEEVTASRIFDRRTYMEPFTADLTNAARDIQIVSPFLQKNRITALLPYLEKAISSGVKISICTRTASNYKPEQQVAITELIDRLMGNGITVTQKDNLQQHYAVFDQSIVWYGSIDYLSFSKKEASALRFENADIAGELLDLFS